MTTPPPAPTPDEPHENGIENRDVAGLSQGRIVLRRFLTHRGALVGMVVLALVAILAFSSIGVGNIPGWWKYAPGDRPAEFDAVNDRGGPTLGLPSWLGGSGLAWGDAPFGRDNLGRDIFARTMLGAQTSLIVMVIMGIVAAVMGIAVGALAGYYRGATDQVLMRFTDLVITFPLIVIGAVLGKMAGGAGVYVLALVLGLVVWTTLARLVRAEFLSLREREFVDAARVAGAGDTRIILKHMLPNAMGPIIVNTTLLMSAAVLLEASLSYLGFGVKAPDISLGKMVSDYQSYFQTRPWLFWWPGAFIIVIALCVNFIGDGLRDAFDPRQRKIPSVRAMNRARLAQQESLVAATPALPTGADVAGVDVAGVDVEKRARETDRRDDEPGGSA
ncbi:ABC transporter permease [Nocardioides zeae]|uniref:ABC transporter permease n=2 Tax=Nocardioides zeae TaxID=1457234 RepID=A0A6P0HN81_9ACTN|nr:ABC transporter permease [Nocardioides zeae]